MKQASPNLFDLSPGSKFGRFTILEPIATGGMGAVYKAEQDQPRRIVALKLIKDGVTSAEALRRFDYESQILAQLQHPGIAQVYDAGQVETTQGPRPYFSMELVDGLPLLEYAEAVDLSRADRLALMAKICDAVHHAHQKGVIHRDLKPANILVTSKGEPKVLDFGVARIADADFMTITMQTDPGQLVGTVPYMSPEQVSVDSLALDTRSDVYALGVVLYELLSGRLPYDIRQQMIFEALRMIREDDPTPLSQLDRTFRGDLDNIVQKALEKDRTRRYSSAAELGQDLTHFLRNEPIVARRPSTYYQLRKFAARNKILVGGVVAVFLTMAVGLFFSVREARRANSAEAANFKLFTSEQQARESAQAAEERTREELEVAQASRDFLHDLLMRASPSTLADVDITVREAVLQAAEDLETRDYHPRVEASIRTAIGRTLNVHADYESAQMHLRRAVELLDASEDARPLERARLQFYLGDAHINAGQPEEAERLYRASMALLESLGEERSVDYARASGGLGRALYFHSIHDEARSWFEHGLQLMEELRGQESQEYIRALTDYAFFLHYGVADPEAGDRYARALELSRKVLGEETTDTADILKNYGRWLTSNRDADEARPLLEANRELMGKMYGERSRQHANALDVLGRLAQNDRDYEEALDLALASYEILKEVLGDHHDTASALHAVAFCHRTLGNYEEAGPLFEEVLRMRIAVFGRKNASVAYTLSDMASLDRDLDRLETAAERGHEAYDLFKATVGADDLHTARAAEDLAHIFLRRGEYDEAFTWFAEAERSALAGRPFTSANMESILVHWMVAMVVRNRMEEFREKLAYAKAELEKLEYRGTFEKITDRLEFLDQALRGEGGEDALEMATDLAVKLSPIQSYPLYSRAAFCRMAAEVQALAGHEEEREEWATLARELWPPIESHWVPR